MSRLIIKGKNVLKGEIKISGNKNAVLPMIAAAMLTDEEVILGNVPDIIDVDAMLEAAAVLGVSVRRQKNRLYLKADNIKRNDIPREICSKIRTSILFAAPLLHRTGKAAIWAPGGDVIGRRRLDAHFYGLHGLGAKIESETIPYTFEVSGEMTGRTLFLDEASVTATEQIMMAAVLAKGQTSLLNAAAEPHVHQLGELLNRMGAKISGLGSNTLNIEGVEKLHGAELDIDGDHIEAGSFLALAAATGSEFKLTGVSPRNFWMTRRVYERLGIHFEMSHDSLFIPGGQKPVIKPDSGNAIPVISDGPWPQFPSDMMSCSIVAATQAEGTVLFFEKMFESRIYFVDRLIAMGANAIVCDPHRVVISGPAKLRAIELSSPDIRAGMALVIASLCASGTGIINNANVIFRGYEDLISKLNTAGADIIYEKK